MTCLIEGGVPGEGRKTAGRMPALPGTTGRWASWRYSGHSV